MNRSSPANGRPASPLTVALGAESAGVPKSASPSALSPEAIEAGHARAEVVRDLGIDDPALLERARQLGIPLDLPDPLPKDPDERADEIAHRKAKLLALIQRVEEQKMSGPSDASSSINHWWAQVPWWAWTIAIGLILGLAAMNLILYQARH